MEGKKGRTLINIGCHLKVENNGKIYKYCLFSEENMALHSKTQFDKYNIFPFAEAAEQYLAGRGELPWCRTRSYFQREVLFTFSNTILQRLVDKPKPFVKPFEATLKYGFQGYSRGERNGIFLLRKHDLGLKRALESCILQHEQELREKISALETSRLHPVKIVWHNPSCERIIGAYNSGNDKMLFLDYAFY